MHACIQVKIASLHACIQVKNAYIINACMNECVCMFVCMYAHVYSRHKYDNLRGMYTP